MYIRSLFFPKTIRFKDTKYNKDISVHLSVFQPTLIVGGLIQSGNVMSKIWKEGLKKLLPKHFNPKSILILGLGGGSNVRLVHKYYPQAKITAVEIDKQMAEIANKYFGLSKIKNLEITITDALEFTSNLKSDEKYDLTLLDCFEGRYIPTKLEDIKFLQTLKNHSRFLLINRIKWLSYKYSTQSFLNKLSTKFFFITTKTISNIIISLV